MTTGSTRAADELAERVNAAKLATLGTLVAGVAHEINTPLGALGSNHDVLRRALARLREILADEVVEPDELEEVRRIVRALNGVMTVNDLAMTRVNTLVSSLRRFGRLDRADVDRVDIHEGIDVAITLLEHELRDRITVVREYGELPRVECYPQQLNQVFMNLLINAIQAMPESGTLAIRSELVSCAESDDASRARPGGGDEVAVSVTDTGGGIAPEDIDRIFEPGFTTKGSRVGMGLGLPIARQTVDRHGGRIEVASAPGQGTTFTVHLPVSLPRA